MRILPASIRRLAASIVWLVVAALPAQGTLIMTASETGGDVLLTAAGTLDLTEWSLQFTNLGPIPGILQGNAGVIAGTSLTDRYNLPVSFSGPSSIGPGGIQVNATSGSGDFVGLIFLSNSFLFVPAGYSSGGALSGSSTFAGSTFASIGLTPGAYVWSWGSGGSADSLTLNIVPEPSTALLFASGLAAMAVRRRRQQFRTLANGVLGLVEAAE